MTPTAAPRLVEIAVGDDPTRWEQAGFSSDDGRVHVGALTIACRPGVTSPSLRFDRPNPSGAPTLDGIGWEVDGAADAGAPHVAATTPHANGITDIDHVVVMAPDLDRLRSAVLDAGLEIRRERATSMGNAPITQVFAWAGDFLLEMVAPTPVPGDAPQDASNAPAELWGVALVAPDLDATVRWFGDGSSPAKPAVQPGRRIATVRHRALGLGLTVAVMSPR